MASFDLGGHTNGLETVKALQFVDLRLFGYLGLFIVPFVLISTFAVGLNHLFTRLLDIGLAVIGSIALNIGFSIFKSMLPSFVPFYADPLLARIDHALLFQHDAWAVAHGLSSPQLAIFLTPAYMQIWAVPALAFPILLSALETNTARKNRFLLIYGFVWLGLGCLAAYAFSSAGPVYYDRVYATDRFSGLTQALGEPALQEWWIRLSQAYLWSAYVTGQQYFATGISAFPSVHVALAVTFALYLYERHHLLGVIGLAFALAVIFLSVYSGYHYLVDGLFSAGSIVALWAYLKKRQGNVAAQ